MFHADYKVPGIGSHPLLVYDVNGDGRNDIVGGNAHGYGLYWMEQTAPVEGKRSFAVHWIEESFGQLARYEWRR